MCFRKEDLGLSADWRNSTHCIFVVILQGFENNQLTNILQHFMYFIILNCSIPVDFDVISF